MSNAHPDADWLQPDPTPPSTPPQPSPFAVRRFESWDERPDDFDTLTAAHNASPPRSPTARIIRVDGTILATAEHAAEWALSRAGNLQVVREAAAKAGKCDCEGCRLMGQGTCWYPCRDCGMPTPPPDDGENWTLCALCGAVPAKAAE